MFGTNVVDRAGFVGMFGEGYAHWFKVTRLLPTHWYHVDAKVRNEERMTPMVLMAADETSLLQILEKRGPDFELTQVQAVIPKWMNKTDSWSMEKLTGVSVGEDRIGVVVCLLEMANGVVYADVHDPSFQIDALTNVRKIF
jgi:hypothetical protein